MQGSQQFHHFPCQMFVFVVGQASSQQDAAFYIGCYDGGGGGGKADVVVVITSARTVVVVVVVMLKESSRAVTDGAGGMGDLAQNRRAGLFHFAERFFSQASQTAGQSTPLVIFIVVTVVIVVFMVFLLTMKKGG
jgi:hypothetical protein